METVYPHQSEVRYSAGSEFLAPVALEQNVAAVEIETLLDLNATEERALAALVALVLEVPRNRALAQRAADDPARATPVDAAVAPVQRTLFA
jgi:hypothetical protein